MSGVSVPQSAWSPDDPFAGHPGPVLAGAVTPDGRQIVSGGEDRTARLWDRTSGQLQTTLTGHTGWVWVVAVTPDGRQIVTGGEDGAARRWDRTSGQQTSLTGHTGWVTAVAVTPDGGEVVSVGNDGAIRVWNQRSGRQVQGTGNARVGAAMPLSGLGSDAPTGEDLLQISGDVDRLAALAAAVSTAPPLSIALLGDWGSGKSASCCRCRAGSRSWRPCHATTWAVARSPPRCGRCGSTPGTTATSRSGPVSYTHLRA